MKLFIITGELSGTAGEVLKDLINAEDRVVLACEGVELVEELRSSAPENIYVLAGHSRFFGEDSGIKEVTLKDLVRWLFEAEKVYSW